MNCQVGKDHLDQQVSRTKKHANGVHGKTTTTMTSPSKSSTMEVPTVVVVGKNDQQTARSSSSSSGTAVISPLSVNLNVGTGNDNKNKVSLGAHPSQQTSADEVDSHRVPSFVHQGDHNVKVNMSKPEVIPRAKTKTTNVQKVAESPKTKKESPKTLASKQVSVKSKSPSPAPEGKVVEAISPVVKMSAEFENMVREHAIKDKVDADYAPPSYSLYPPPSSSSSPQATSTTDNAPAVIDVQEQLEIKMPSQASQAKVEVMDKASMNETLQEKIPSMILMKGETDLKKEHMIKSPHVEIEMTSGENLLGKNKVEDNAREGSISPEKGKSKKSKEKVEKSSKDKAEKSKDKVEKVKESKKDKDKSKSKETTMSNSPSSEVTEGGAATTSGSGEKSGKFGKFGFGLPDIHLNFGKGSKSSSSEDKGEGGEGDGLEKVVVVEQKGKSSSDEKKPAKGKDKAPKSEEMSSKSKPDEHKNEQESSSSLSYQISPVELSSSLTMEPTQGAEQKEHPTEQAKGDLTSGKDKKPLEKSSSSGFGFSLKFPSFDKPILKRKDSSGSASGGEHKEGEVDKDPKGGNKTSSKEAGKKEKKEKDGKNKKDSGESRPTSPEQKEPENITSEDEMISKQLLADSTDGENNKQTPNKKGSGFHMPHLGIKLPKFGHSKQTYSFENAGEVSGKEGKGTMSEIPTSVEGESSAIVPPTAVKVELSSQVGDLDDQKIEKAIEKKVEGEVMKKMKAVPSVEMKLGSVEEKEMTISPVQLTMSHSPPPPIPTVGISVDRPLSPEASSGPGKEEKKLEDQQEMMNGESKEIKVEKQPGFVSKGLKGLRDLKDKVTGKLSHDPNQGGHMSSSEDEGGDDDEQKVKNKKAQKEAKEKAAAEAKKEKERIKEEKKMKKAELKAKKASASAAAQQSSDSSSSSDESDGGEEGSTNNKKDKKKKSKDNKSGKKDKESKKGKKSTPVAGTVEEEKSQQQVTNVSMAMSPSESKDKTKPPVAPRKSKEPKEEMDENNSQKQKSKKSKDKKSKSGSKDTKSVGDGKHSSQSSSSSSSSSSSESDDDKDNNDDSKNKEKKPKKPKRSLKRKAPPVPPLEEKTVDTNTRMTITTSAEVISPPKDKTKLDSSTAEPSSSNNSYAKTPESGRRSASFGDLSSLHQQPKTTQHYDSLERAMSLDMAGGDTNEPMNSSHSKGNHGGVGGPSGGMPLGSPLEDLSADPDSAIPHFNREMGKLGKKVVSSSSNSSSSSLDTLKGTATSPPSQPTSVVHVFPKESLTVVTHTHTEATPTQIRINGVSSGTSSSTDPVISIVDGQQPPTQIQKMMTETISMMNNIRTQMDSPGLVRSVGESRVTFTTPSPSTPADEPSSSSIPRGGEVVTISTSGSSVLDKAEVERVAREAVDEIMAQVNAGTNANGTTVADSTPSNKEESSTSVIVGSTSSGSSNVKVEGVNVTPISLGKNITVMNIKNVPEQAPHHHHHHHQDFEGDESSVEPSSTIITQSPSTASSSSLLLRGDSKSRLMQTVADANTIKVNPISPLRKDSSLTSSSSSVDSSSPEIRNDSGDNKSKPLMSFPSGIPRPVPHRNNNSNSTTDSASIATKACPTTNADNTNNTIVTTRTSSQTIEISSKELDRIMMSHAEFLQKQQQAVLSHNISSPAIGTGITISGTLIPGLDDEQTINNSNAQPQASFDNWVYVEQKNSNNNDELTCPHSDPEPSTSSSNDDEDLPYNRNGALSPTTYKMETEYKYETSEMRVTSSPLPPGDNNTTTTTVYSTTMTLPQKTVTQITLGEPIVDSSGRIISKITLDSPVTTHNAGDNSSEEDLPKLQPMK